MDQRLLLVPVLCLIVGCTSGAGNSSETAPAYGPHGGLAVRLPQGRGFGEVLLEPDDPTGRKPFRHVAVYFLHPDLQSSLESLPNVAEVKLLVPGMNEPMIIGLKPNPDPRSTGGQGRFTSGPGEFPIDQVVGELRGSFGAERFVLPFASPR